jgi:hypothetical protein
VGKAKLVAGGQVVFLKGEGSERALRGSCFWVSKISRELEARSRGEK